LVKVYTGKKGLADKQTLWFVYMHLTDQINIPILVNLMMPHTKGSKKEPTSLSVIIVDMATIS